MIGGVRQHLRVIYALVLRDIKTRLGSSYFGFLFGLLIPLAHLVIVLTVYIATGRRAPIGSDVSIYLLTAIVPFIIWSYTHQKTMQSFSQYFSLTALPIVRLIDIFISRSIVELLNSSIIALISGFLVVLLTSDPYIQSMSGVIFGVLLSYILGISTGLIFGIGGLLAPIINIIGFVIIPIYWIMSGILFIPDGLPAEIRSVLYFFPLAHIVDYCRIEFYSNYMTSFADIRYVLTISILNILVSMITLKCMRNNLNI